MATDTSVKYGNDLMTIVKQPSGNIHLDAYGLAQAQVTYAFDTSNMSTVITNCNAGLSYPSEIGISMKSYKYSFSSAKSNVTMLTVDFMGVARSGGYTDAQISGVSTTASQPIETHPNFTNRTDQTIGDSSNPIAGTPPQAGGVNYNDAIFTEVPNSNPRQFTFGGFGVQTDITKAPNKKAGVRQFLRPMFTVRGQMFFANGQVAKVNNLKNTVGRTFNSTGDVNILIAPLNETVNGRELLTAANIEVIGKPSDPAGYKVTYDILFSPYVWDTDIYGKGQSSIF
jgi:hypothetical protein